MTSKLTDNIMAIYDYEYFYYAPQVVDKKIQRFARYDCSVIKSIPVETAVSERLSLELKIICVYYFRLHTRILTWQLFIDLVNKIKH